MPGSRADHEPSLPEFLSSRARRASDARLAFDVAGGFVIAVGAALWQGPGWLLLTSGAACFLAYGAWGITDRELTERTGTSQRGLALLRAVRVAATVVGGVAAVTLILGGLYIALGRNIS